MAKVKLNLSKLSIEDKITLGNNIKTSMTGNANFTTPNPTLAAYGTLITNLTNANAAYVAGVSSTKTLLLARNAAETAFDAGTTLEAAYAENASGGDPVKLQSGGFNLKSASSPVGMPDQVANLSATAGDADGEIDLQWDPVTGAKSYNVLASPDPITSTSWVNKPSVTKSKTAVTGLTSGARLWFKVAAVGAAGVGAFSDPATKIAP